MLGSIGRSEHASVERIALPAARSKGGEGGEVQWHCHYEGFESALCDLTAGGDGAQDGGGGGGGSGGGDGDGGRSSNGSC